MDAVTRLHREYLSRALVNNIAGEAVDIIGRHCAGLASADTYLCKMEDTLGMAKHLAASVRDS